MIFIKYCKEGGLFNPGGDKYENLLKKFRNGGEISFSYFGDNFNKHIYKYKGLEIQIGGKYINGELSEIVRTIYSK